MLLAVVNALLGLTALASAVQEGLAGGLFWTFVAGFAAVVADGATQLAPRTGDVPRRGSTWTVPLSW